jgi:hypothetical protein
MQQPSKKFSKIAVWIATPLAVLLAGGLVWQSSYAAFTATTKNAGNSWSTGQVVLTNDSAGSARFTVANMLPGQTDTKCITVTANATVPGVVKGYAINPVTSSAGLENYIDVTVVEGAGGSFASCTGFTPASGGGVVVNDLPLSTVYLANSYATGFGGWTIAGTGNESRTYQITWTFDTTGLSQTALNNLQGVTTGLDFQWELQSS